MLKCQANCAKVTNSESKVAKNPKYRGLKPYKPGENGNKGGRPKGFAALIREKTKDGLELVELSLQVMRGELTVTRYTLEGESYEASPSVKDRLQAMEWLADRGFGKAIETMRVEGEGADLVATIAIAIARKFHEPEMPPCPDKPRQLNSLPDQS